MIEMARAVELLGLRAYLTESIMDSGEGLPATWGIRTTDECIQVGANLIIVSFATIQKKCFIVSKVQIFLLDDQSSQFGSLKRSFM